MSLSKVILNCSKNYGIIKIGCFFVAVSILLIFASYFLIKNLTRNSCIDRNFLINPRFACSNDFVIEKREYGDIRNRFIEYIEEEKSMGYISDASIYFRDLEAGPIMAINEKKDFIPASLLKIPLALVFFTLHEEGNVGIFDTYIEYNIDNIAQTLVQEFKPDNSLVDGQIYSIEDLVHRMLVHSDNISAQLLYEFVLENYGYELIRGIYRNLGIIDAGSSVDISAVNTKDYASIFRQLYNSSYLSPTNSQKFLRILSNTNFDRGLAYGIPKYVVLANKFGERYLEDGSKQLHDCGIVYYPDNPYLLCVMTSGYDFEYLSNFIGRISSEVYEEVDSRRI